MQYTIRKIPKSVDEALRERALAEKKSLNRVAVEALGRALGLDLAVTRRRDLSELAGRWQADPDFERAIADQDQVDDEAWD